MSATFTLDELAALTGGTLVGASPGSRVSGVQQLDLAGPEHVSFFNHAAYLPQFAATKAGLVVVERKTANKQPGLKPYLVVPNASLAFARISRRFHPEPQVVAAIHPTAVVEPGAELHPSCRVDALAYVGAGAKVGPGTHLHVQSFVGEGAVLGAGCRVGVGAKVLHGCVLGDRVWLQPGVVIGGDGFGYALDLEEGQHLKVPQVGNVVIGDDVEIGANSCIDRATLGSTQVGRGTKVDNLVQIGHNVTVGEMTILCGQVGLSGSSKVGGGAILGGQVGVANHLVVGDGARLAGQSGLGDDVPDGETWGGSPALPARIWMRNAKAFGDLADTVAKVRKLEKLLEPKG